MEEAKKLCREFDLSVELYPRRRPRPTRIPRKLEGDVLVSENIGDSGRFKTDVDTLMRTDMYNYPATDTTLTELMFGSQRQH